ncbi:tetratricopeptide repeat protein [Desulfobaculum sp.]
MLQGQQGTPFQRVRRNIARASHALQKEDYTKAIAAAKTAFQTVPKCRNLYGQQKIELKFMLEDFCGTFSTNPGILDILAKMHMRVRPYIKYDGNPALIVNRLDILQTRIEDLEREKEEQTRAAMDQKRQEYLAHAEEYFRTGETPRAKSYLRRVVDEYGDTPGVITDVGKRMLDAELFVEAAEVLEESRARFPGDAAAYQHCVNAYLGMQEYSKAETVYKDALRQFGNHPRTLLNLSKLYLAWRKRDDAYEYARRALEADPGLDEARKIMEKTE